MMGLSFKMLSSLQAVIAGVIYLELQPAPQNNDVAAPVASAMPEQTIQVKTQPSDHIDGVRTIIERPLFSPGRRPPAPPADEQSVPVELPRLTSVLVYGNYRSIIFAPKGDAKPLIVHEGSQVGEFTVQTIQAGQVVIAGPDGVRVLRPGFEFVAPVLRPPSLP